MIAEDQSIEFKRKRAFDAGSRYHLIHSLALLGAHKARFPTLTASLFTGIFCLYKRFLNLNFSLILVQKSELSNFNWEYCSSKRASSLNFSFRFSSKFWLNFMFVSKAMEGIVWLNGWLTNSHSPDSNFDKPFLTLKFFFIFSGHNAVLRSVLSLLDHRRGIVPQIHSLRGYSVHRRLALLHPLNRQAEQSPKMQLFNIFVCWIFGFYWVTFRNKFTKIVHFILQ